MELHLGKSRAGKVSISFVLSECLVGIGEYKIKSFDEDRCHALQDVTLWSGSDCYGYGREVLFSSSTWKPIGEKIGISFTGINEAFQYEIKVLMLSLYSFGIGEGMPALKWSTIVSGIRSLMPLAKYLLSKDIDSWQDIEKLNKLKIRNHISNFLNEYEFYKKPSFSTSMNTAVRWLKYYKLIGDDVESMLSERLSPIIIAHSKSGRRSHPVIPTGVMKKLILSVISELESTTASVNMWIRIQKEDIKRIESKEFQIVNGRYKSVRKGEKGDSIYTAVNRIRGLVNILVLAFTGMRDGEVLALRNDCLVIRNSEEADLSYALVSELSKTTDGIQKLEWVCNEVASKYVSLLSSLNEVVFVKASAILKNLADEISEDYLNELQNGLKQKYLFSSNYTVNSCGFYRMSKRPSSLGFNISQHFNISVTSSDIHQLEQLGCNYRSVAPNKADGNEKYKVGDYFNFTPHQFRHTFAWFIIANRLGELDDIRYQYKHLWQNMTLIYSRRGYESIGQLLNIADDFSRKISNLTVQEIVDYSLSNQIAGKGGERFNERIRRMLGDQATDSVQPHFQNMSQVVEFISNNSNELRGVAHGYCTKGSDCKVKNIVDPSHCINCDGYIATPRHLPYWEAIKTNCEHKLEKIESAPKEMREKLKTFKAMLQKNLESANIVIESLQNSKANIVHER